MSSVTLRIPRGLRPFGSPKSRTFSPSMGSTSTRFLSAAHRLWSPAWPPAAFISGAPAAAQFWLLPPRDMISKLSPRLTAATHMISWSDRTSKGPKISVAKRSRSPASAGRAGWVSCWLEHLGLDQQRDNIRMQVIGDQAVQVQCVENGLCDAAAVDGVFSRQLKQEGMTILGEFTDVKTLLVGQTMAVPATLLQQRPDVAESYLKGELEALAFSLAPKNKPVVLKTLGRWLKVDSAGSEDAYQDLVRGVDRKPFASLEGMRNVQRLLKSRNPKVGEVKAEEVIDNRLMRKLDETGFIDKMYGTYGAKL